MSSDFFDLDNMACAFCSWLILSGSRAALCKRCTPLVKTPGYLGPIPMLPVTMSRRECWACRARTGEGSGSVPMSHDPSKAVFCQGCITRATAHRRPAPMDQHDVAAIKTFGEGTGIESRRNWFP